MNKVNMKGRRVGEHRVNTGDEEVEKGELQGEEGKAERSNKTGARSFNILGKKKILNQIQNK